MNISLDKVEALLGYFQQLQRKYGYRETGNIIKHKWDMRAVAMQMESREDLMQLIQFFMLFSDDRSFQHFFNEYDKYFDTMQQVKLDRARRRYLQQETLKKMKEDQIES